MKVILTEEIHGLGERGDIVNVRDGYARNYLLPKNFAKVATEGNLKVVEQQKQKWEDLTKKERAEAEKLAERISETKLQIAKKVGDTGTLYGSVTNVEIAEALAAQGIEIDKRRIELAEAIKTPGTHEATVRVYHGVDAKLEIEVVAETEEASA